MSQAKNAESKVLLKICLWENRANGKTLRSTRTLPVEPGLPVAWALGKVAQLCSEFFRFVTQPDADSRYRLEDSEAFWFTPVDTHSVLHVVHDVN